MDPVFEGQTLDHTLCAPAVMRKIGRAPEIETEQRDSNNKLTGKLVIWRMTGRC